MELHHLHHLVAVAEELSFSRAAQRLRMAQPPLSQSIKRLEASLSMTLFARSGRKIELTPAGHVFYNEAKVILMYAERATLMARRAAAGETGSLRVGYIAPAVFHVLPAIFNNFRKKAPGIKVKFEEHSVEEQIALLQTGQLDIAFILGRRSLPLEIETCLLQTVGLEAAIPSCHPLASRRQIYLKDLADCDIIAVSRERHPDFHDSLHAACREQGFTLRIEHSVDHTMTVLSLVAGGFGIGLMAGMSEEFGMTGMKFIPIIDAPRDPIARSMLAAWVPRGKSPTLQCFLSTVQSIVKAKNGSWAGKSNGLAPASTPCAIKAKESMDDPSTRSS